MAAMMPLSSGKLWAWYRHPPGLAPSGLLAWCALERVPATPHIGADETLCGRTLRYMGPTASGPTQTAASQTSRLDRRTAEEEDDQQGKEAVAEVRRRMEEITCLLDTVFTVAEAAVMESADRKEPQIALAS